MFSLHYARYDMIRQATSISYLDLYLINVFAYISKYMVVYVGCRVCIYTRRANLMNHMFRTWEPRAGDEWYGILQIKRLCERTTNCVIRTDHSNIRSAPATYETNDNIHNYVSWADRVCYLSGTCVIAVHLLGIRELQKKRVSYVFL